jgi:hypothetical protein
MLKLTESLKTTPGESFSTTPVPPLLRKMKTQTTRSKTFLVALHSLPDLTVPKRLLITTSTVC